MSEVYVVTEGCYSDYHIVGVYTNKDAADIVAAKFYGQVEIYKLDAGINEIRQGLTSYDVTYYRTEDIKAYNNSSINNETDYKSVFAYPSHKDRDDVYYLRTWCWARDEDHAVKIGSERFAQYRAMTHLTENLNKIS